MAGKKKAEKFICLCLCFTLMITSTGCGLTRKDTAFETQYFDLFDTVTSFTIYTDSKASFQELSAKLYQKLKQYHRLYTIYEDVEGIPNLKTINEQAGIQPVKVGPEILGLLSFGIEMYEKTEGYVNIAFGSVLEIWHEYRENGLENPGDAKVPEMEELRQAKAHTDIGNVWIDEKASTVYLADPEMSLDVGAIAKGYAVEQLAGYAKEAGVESAILNVGGNVRTIGSKPDGTKFAVGVQNPDPEGEEPFVYKLMLSDEAMVTSGDYQRYYEVDGVRYHHIINQDTLFPSNAYRSVTILTTDSGLADALSTAVFNMPMTEGKKFVEAYEGVEAVFVLSDGTIWVTGGLA